MMKIDLICGTCIFELSQKGIKNIAYSDAIPTPVTELRDNGIYSVTCLKGHETEVILNNHKAELLFELGLNAIIDGYYRDSVASITASLERFYEFFIKIVWRKQGNEFLAIEKAWKNISNQSERQIGAFIGLYLSEFKNQPILLNPQTETKFRNEVIHKGYIPNREEAINYASTVLNLIEEPLLALKTTSMKFVYETFNYYSPVRLAKENKEVNEDLIITNILPTIDILNGRNDYRAGDIFHQLERITNDRIPKLTYLYDVITPVINPSKEDIEKAEKYVKQAIAKEKKGELNNAINLYNKSIRLVKYNYGALKGKLRIALVQKKNFSEINLLVNCFLDLDAKNPTIGNDLLGLFAEVDRINDLIKLLSLAISNYKENLHAYGNLNFYLGTIWRLENNKRQAIKYFTNSKNALKKCLPDDNDVFNVIKENLALLDKM